MSNLQVASVGKPDISSSENANVEVESFSKGEMMSGGLLTEDDHEFLNSCDDAFRKRTLRKLDIRLIPMLGLLYLISYLDRTNIGTANIEGLTEDLGLTSDQYNIALSIFFIPYVLLEVPSNTILLKFKRPSTYIGIIVIAWGTVITLIGIVQGFGGLVAARVALGIAEAGFFPAAVFIISRWYLPNETQSRLALFYTASALAGAFSGLLAFAIAKMDGVAGLEGWRWIFILEGIASVVLGISCFFLLVDSPALSTRWLTTDEIRFLELRHLVHHSAQVSDLDTSKKQKWAILKSILLDWKIYTLALVYWSNIVPNLGLKFTMPQIIKNMGFTSSNAQLMTIPPYMCGTLSAYVSARLADRYTWRMPFIVGPQFLVVISFAILFPLSPKIKDNVGVCYFAVILSCLGLYPISPGTSAWTVNNLAGPTKRAQGVAYMLTIGNAGGIISSFIYKADEAPRYATGFGTSLAFAAAGILACFALEYGYHQINRKRAMLDEDAVRAEYSRDELTLMGDKSPLFRYTL